MKAVVVLLCAVALVGAVSEDMENHFQLWRVQNQKFYATREEYVRRLGIFAQNMQWAENFNAGNHTFTVGATVFADLTNAEYRTLLGRRPIDAARRVAPRRNVFAPDNVDWTTTGAVYAVKNQGQCGSCWAFSATAAMESARVIDKKDSLIALSEQQLVDCASDTGNEGCNGGDMDAAFQHVINNKGACSMADYPYTGKDGTCKKTCTVVKDTDFHGFYDVAENDSSALVDAAAEHVVSVAIEADQLAFQLYRSGIFSASCGTNLDHGVTLVGYGVSGTTLFWKIKNSWGTTWGEAGYMRMIRITTKGPGECGIAMDASYPTY